MRASLLSFSYGGARLPNSSEAFAKSIVGATALFATPTSLPSRQTERYRTVDDGTSSTSGSARVQGCPRSVRFDHGRVESLFLRSGASPHRCCTPRFPLAQ